MRLSDNWDFFECVIEGVTSFVMVDLGAHEQAPDPGRPISIRIEIQFQDPQPNGLPTSDEAEALHGLEDALDEALGSGLSAVYVGRVSGGGVRHFYFYAPASDDLEECLEQVGEGFPAYPLGAGERDDPEWEQYLEFLYPNVLGWQYMSNRQLTKALREHGDPLTVPRPVDHLALFDDEEAARGFAATVGNQGFEVGEVTREDDESDWSVPFQRVHAVDLAAANDMSYGLVRLCQEFMGQYDGWGCPIVRDDAAAE